MKSIHLKFPDGFLERLESQRKKDRLSPDRSEFIRRLLDLQLSRLETTDAREKSRRPRVATPVAATQSPRSDTARSIQVGPEAIIVDGVPTPDVVIEIEMSDGSIVHGVPKNASPELLAHLDAPTGPVTTKSEQLEEPADLGDAKPARGLLGNLLDERA
jgi:Arc/MetJ-type ribon-helix-helix transcriptional regulator